MFGPILAAAALGSYHFGPDTAHEYRLDIQFDGFLPVFGGNEGVADIGLKMAVKGLEPSPAGLRATGELTEFTFSFNGAPLPLDLDSITGYIPKSSVTASPQGRLLETDAPDKRPPVPLPGLEAKRFPELTYLPIELPAEGLKEAGQAWSFERPFSAGPMQYRCRLESLSGGRAKIAVELSQTVAYLETAALEQTQDRAEAAAEVESRLEGKGTVVFNVGQGCPDAVDVSMTSTAQVKPIPSGDASTRVLKMTLKTRRTGAAESP
jgi:hypothetical protein